MNFILNDVDELLAKDRDRKRFQARAVEIIYNGHIEAEKIFTMLRALKVGLYAAFVKWHNGITNPLTDKTAVGRHTHVGVVLREKPRWNFDALKSVFQVGEVGPNLVNRLGKGNRSPLKKLKNYVGYLTDGHDNCRFKDSWNYKFDYELNSTNLDGKLLCQLARGLLFENIIEKSDWTTRAYVMKHKDKLDRMVHNWRRYKEDATSFYSISDFKSEVIQFIFANWQPEKQTLVLQGCSNMGKTELAKAILKWQFPTEKPLFCRNINKLKHRGVTQPFILDDMNFSFFSRSKLIALLDVENDSDIRILYGIHTIAAGVRRIITTNEEYVRIFGEVATCAAIQRRVAFIQLDRFVKLY